jgi:hypothetical protein
VEVNAMAPEPTRLPVVVRELAGQQVEWLQESDGTLWLTMRTAAELLGYTSSRALWATLNQPEVAEEVAPYTRVMVTMTPGGAQKTRLLREAAVFIVGQHMKGKRGRIVRERLALHREQAAKQERVTASMKPPVEALQDVLVDAAGAVEQIRDAAPEGDHRAAGTDVLTALDEQLALLEVLRTGRLKAGVCIPIRDSASKENKGKGPSPMERLLRAVDGRGK